MVLSYCCTETEVHAAAQHHFGYGRLNLLNPRKLSSIYCRILHCCGSSFLPATDYVVVDFWEYSRPWKILLFCLLLSIGTWPLVSNQSPWCFVVALKLYLPATCTEATCIAVVSGNRIVFCAGRWQRFRFSDSYSNMHACGGELSGS